MANPSAEELFERWKRAGDIQALGAAFDRTAPELLQLARRLCRDRLEAEDLVQATWLGAIESAQRFDPERNLTAWLAGILVRQAGLARRRTERADVRGDLDPAHEPDPAAALESRDLADALARSLEHLTPAEREVVVPLLLDERRTVEIARELALRPRTAQRRISRGLAKLRRLMGPGLGLGVLLDRRALAQIKARVTVHAAAASAGNGAVTIPISLAAGGIALSKLAGILIVVALASVVWLLAGRPRLGSKSSEPVIAQSAPDESAGVQRSGTRTPEPAPAVASRAVVPVDSTEAAARSQPRTDALQSTPAVGYGRVLEEDGTPVSGAEIQVVSHGRVREWIRVGDSVQAAPLIRSGRDGRFQFQAVSRSDDYLRVSADGFGRAIAPVVTGCSAPDRALLIRMRLASRMVVEVCDASGSSSVGRRVVATTSGFELIPSDLPSLGINGIEPESWTSELGADGMAELDGLPAFASLALALHEGERELTRLPDKLRLEPGETRRIQLTLGGAATIAGRMLDEAERPVAREAVWLVPASESIGPLIPSHLRPRQQTLTDDQGAFAFDGVTPADWVVGPAPGRNDPDALAPEGKHVRVDPGSSRSEVTLHVFRGYFIRGRVLETNGGPVRVTVIVSRVDPFALMSVASGEDGRFSLGPLLPGEYSLTAGGPQSTYAVSDPIRVQAGSDEVRLTVAPGATLRGRIVDEQGALVAFAELHRAREENGGPFSWMSEYIPGQMFAATVSQPPQGTFEFLGLTPGVHCLSASTLNGEFGSMRVTLEPKSAQCEVVLVVHPGARLRITCKNLAETGVCRVELDGIAVAGAYIEPKQSANIVVPAGTLRVLCRASQDGSIQERTIRIAVGEEQAVEFTGGD